MINILTDSTADIPKDLAQQLNIGVIPAYIHLDGKSYKDGEEIQPSTLFELVKETKNFPTTSAPSLGDFLKFFDLEGPSIFISLSSQLSTTYRNAQLAKKELETKTIEVIDGKSISTGYGQIVIQAAKWRNKGMSFEELILRIKDRIENTQGVLILDTVDYLYHGGRCSKIDSLFSSLLSIKPFLRVLPDGTLGVLQKVRGSREKILKVMASYFIKQLANKDIPEIYITHYDSVEDANLVADQITSFGKPIEIHITEVGCALATHSGPNPLGIAYYIH